MRHRWTVGVSTVSLIPPLSHIYACGSHDADRTYHFLSAAEGRSFSPEKKRVFRATIHETPGLMPQHEIMGCLWMALRTSAYSRDNFQRVRCGVSRAICFRPCTRTRPSHVYERKRLWPCLRPARLGCKCISVTFLWRYPPTTSLIVFVDRRGMYRHKTLQSWWCFDNNLFLGIYSSIPRGQTAAGSWSWHRGDSKNERKHILKRNGIQWWCSLHYLGEAHDLWRCIFDTCTGPPKIKCATPFGGECGYIRSNIVTGDWTVRQPIACGSPGEVLVGCAATARIRRCGQLLLNCIQWT